MPVQAVDNHDGLFKQQLEAYSEKGGGLRAGLYDPEAFDAKLWAEVVNKGKKRLVGKTRNGAYNVGTFGASKGAVAVDVLAEKLPVMIGSLREVVKTLSRLTPGRAHADMLMESSRLLAVLQHELCVGGTDWVGYQVCLDLGVLNPDMFYAEKVAVAGPGAIACLAQIYPTFPYGCQRMCRDSAARSAAVPFLHMLTDCVGHCKEGHFLREVLVELGLPLPHVNDVEYWLCELRQADDAKEYGGSGKASQEYIDALRMFVLAEGKLAGYTY